MRSIGSIGAAGFNGLANCARPDRVGDLALDPPEGGIKVLDWPPRCPALVGELSRVTRPGSLVAVVEQPTKPPHTDRGRLCELDEAILVSARRIRGLFERAELGAIELRHLLFFPSRGELLRRIGRRLSGLPLGAQYMAPADRAPAV
jgi:hypothetical protein